MVKNGSTPPNKWSGGGGSSVVRTDSPCYQGPCTEMPQKQSCTTCQLYGGWLPGTAEAGRRRGPLAGSRSLGRPDTRLATPDCNLIHGEIGSTFKPELLAGDQTLCFIAPDEDAFSAACSAVRLRSRLHSGAPHWNLRRKVPAVPIVNRQLFGARWLLI